MRLFDSDRKDTSNKLTQADSVDNSPAACVHMHCRGRLLFVLLLTALPAAALVALSVGAARGSVIGMLRAVCA